MSNVPMQYIPFAQTVAPLFKVVMAESIIRSRVWHARQAATWGARMQAGLPGYQRFGLPRKTSYLARDASVPEDVRGSVFNGSS